MGDRAHFTYSFILIFLVMLCYQNILIAFNNALKTLVFIDILLV